jgi:hypothetical protein
MTTKTIAKVVLAIHANIVHECNNESECIVNTYINIIIVFIIFPLLIYYIVSNIIHNKPFLALFQLFLFFVFYSILD